MRNSHVARADGHFVRNVRQVLGASARLAMRLVAPPTCASCDAPVSGEPLFCNLCEPNGVECAHFDRLVTGLPVVSAGLYVGALRVAVQRLKYRNRPDLARPLGERLARALGDVSLPDAALLVPVPIHPSRLAARGFNQSALLADAVAQKLGLRSAPRALVRTRLTEEQATLSRRSRLENVDGAFSVKESVRSRAVIVVDDVVTTGATALGCAASLTAAGARVVAVAAIARADRAPELR